MVNDDIEKKGKTLVFWHHRISVLPQDYLPPEVFLGSIISHLNNLSPRHCIFYYLIPNTSQLIYVPSSRLS